MGSISEYVLAQQEKEFVGIPLHMPELNKLMCGIDKGDSWLITAQTSTFKSAFTMAELVLPSVEWILERAVSGLDIKVFYYLLEENEQDLEARILSHLFMKLFGIKVSENQLHGRNGEKLSSKEKSLLPRVTQEWDRLRAKIEIIDHCPWAYPMYLHVKEYLESVGKVVEQKDEEGRTTKVYVPNNPDQYVFVIIDHIGDMIHSKEEKSLFGAIEDLYAKYLMQLKNLYRAIPFVVQQQTNVGDQISTDFKGKTIESKLSPSTAELADNKGTARRALQIISLFNPASYELESYKGYKGIQPWQGQFLYLFIHKNRRGPKNVGRGLWVEPVSKTFEEFPAPQNLADQEVFLKSKGISGPMPGPTGFSFNGIKPS